MFCVKPLQGFVGHFGTYQSLIYGVESARKGNLAKLRAELFSKPLPKFGPKLQKRLVSMVGKSYHCWQHCKDLFFLKRGGVIK